MNNLMIAAISGENVIMAIVWLVVGALIFFILDWGLKKVGLPEPFNKIATVLLVLLVVVIAINALFLIVGKPFIRW